jgi:hypothetical protein
MNSMKKIIWIYIAVIALGVFALSCDNVEPTPQFVKTNTQITATPSTTAVAPVASDSLEDVISFSWNDPGYAIGLEKSKFTIRVGPSGKNFSTFLNKEFTGALSGALLGKELNGIALRFGGLVGQPIPLDVVVVASQSNNNEPIISNVMPITVTPYGDLMIKPSATSVVLSGNKPSDVALTLTWSSAFVGFKGVKAYQLQHAKGGTDFALPTTTDVTAFSQSYTHFNLNKVALAYGIPPLTTGNVDFRIKATNELGTVLYSNVVTVAISTYVAFNSIGIIGDATPGGWPTDTDMYRPDTDKPTEWRVRVYLVGGKEAKFRAEDSWTDNWGATGFPSGTGTQNGSNIPISTTGYYQVDFNAATGAYTFTNVDAPVFISVSLIGEETGWSSDIADLTKDTNNDQVWSGNVTLAKGKLKFRANHDWTTNWGTLQGASATNLSGYSRLNGGDMEIATAGQYFVYINVATGEYFFGKTDQTVAYADIGVIGSATPGGWSDDTNLTKSPVNPFRWSGMITLTDGEGKLRANNDWAVNWGGELFPVGIGRQNGPNFPVTSGTYFVTFNTATGDYSFVK